MTNCKEIFNGSKSKFPIKVEVEIMIESQTALDNSVKHLNDIEWSWGEELADILQSK